MADDPKPVVIDGQTVRPKWDWSPEYRAEVRQSLIASTPAERERASFAEDEYARGWARRRGLACMTDGELAYIKKLIRHEQSR